MEHFATEDESNDDDKNDEEEKKKETDNDTTAKENYSNGLSSKEQELFEDLKENKLSTEQITDLVKGGVLTEKLVEKFLNELNVPVEENVKEVDIPSKKNKKDDEIEGFTVGGSFFAKY
jgi:hypothetical protein